MDTPSISADLNTAAAFQWLWEITFPSVILSGALSIMHPQFYDASMEGIQHLKDWSSHNDPRMNEALALWPTAFTNISVIANRSTPLHCDPHSCAGWYDLLVNVGDHKPCVMAIPNLGLELLYTPGTTVAFSS
ncbi:hypothetical protein SCLCIDRAFT_34316 [Scleroderma citrinum Foug A]|uniref:2OGFeDO JBP1/TET oxygenase domain-containing protein n=1 Tax=Scleroderma citrinum Foug A TaxID=1036808 RepID=A0A0C3CP74_9AGAM|nr:hypothetical protein SCLCIDRAFT_34316 [Scleroderma citrinum Foug A]